MSEFLSLSPLSSAFGEDPNLYVTLGALAVCLGCIGVGLLLTRLTASKPEQERQEPIAQA